MVFTNRGPRIHPLTLAALSLEFTKAGLQEVDHRDQHLVHEWVALGVKGP